MGTDALGDEHEVSVSAVGNEDGHNSADITIAWDGEKPIHVDLTPSDPAAASGGRQSGSKMRQRQRTDNSAMLGTVGGAVGRSGFRIHTSSGSSGRSSR